MSTEVKVFNSTDTGAPVLSSIAGTLISVLDACLTNGYGSVTLDSVVIAGNVATCTKSTGHGLTALGSVGPVIRMSGVSVPSALNADWRITVVSSTVFTFATTGLTDQTATGTISAKRAPAGFTKAFSGTNLAAYRSDDVVGTRLYLRVDDTGTTTARIRGYEVMTDVSTGTGLFPTDTQISGGGYCAKANAANVEWILLTDGRMIYFFCDYSNNNTYLGGFVFGDIDSYVSSDPHGCVLICATAAGTPISLCYLSNTDASYLARSYTQLGTSTLSARYSHGKSTYLGAGGQSYPAPANNSIYLWPVECWEGADNARGMMPGLWNPIHRGTIEQGLTIENIPNLPGRELLIQIVNSPYQAAFDITGPWR